MEKRIWKYSLEVADFVGIEMPVGAEILTVQIQNGIPCIWALIDPRAGRATKRFRIIGTGHWLEDDSYRYVGTFQLFEGNFVGHVFEITS